MDVSEKIDRFIEKNIYFIERDDWAFVYENLDALASGDCVGEFSYRMLEAGINPLLHLNCVPDHFLFSTRLDPKTKKRRDLINFKIPEGIKSIGTFAFNDSCVSQLILPKSLERIDDYPYNDGMVVHIPSIEMWKKLKLGNEADIFKLTFQTVIAMINGEPINKCATAKKTLKEIGGKRHLLSGSTENNVWDMLVALKLSNEELNDIALRINKVISKK